MGEFVGEFGDRRRNEVLARLEEAMVAQSSVVVRRLGGGRAGEMSVHRVLSAPEVSAAGLIESLALRTARAAAGRRVVVAQDTSEVNFPGHGGKRLGDKQLGDKQLGPAGRTGATAGFFVHAAVAVDADAEAVLGVVAGRVWTRDADTVADRRGRALAGKESYRWLEVAELASARLAATAQRIVVGDRESDIYQLFARRPADVELVVRAAQDRALAGGASLFAAASAWPALGRQAVKVASRGPGDPGRVAVVELRAGVVELAHPRNGKREGDPARLSVRLIEAMEADAPTGVTPLHWRLLTTLPGTDFAAAAEAVRLYRLRWRIEQCFRMLKSDGLRLEQSQTADAHRLFNLAAMALGAAVRIIQLVDARDGGSRPADDVASEAEIDAALALGPTLEGKTARQRNPHPPRSLAWLSWIVARLGGWNCYYKPPGPKTMRQGWDRFAAMAEGFALARTRAQSS